MPRTNTPKPRANNANAVSKKAVDAQDPVEEQVDDLSDQVDKTGKAAKSRASDLKDTARAKASGLADQAKSMAEDRAEDVKMQATARIGETAAHIRNAGHEFGSDSYQAQAADYLADSLIEAADRIRAQDLDSVARDLSDYARRNPAVVLGGAALLGFSVARLLKASDRGGRA